MLWQERAVSTHPSHKTKPQVHGGWVAWLDYPNGSIADLYRVNLRTNQEHALFVNEAHEDGVALAGTRLIWQDYLNGQVDRYAGTLGVSTTSGEKREELAETRPSPNPSSDRVTFRGHLGGAPEALTVIRLRGSGSSPVWDGCDASGQRVPPGLYIAALALRGTTPSDLLVRILYIPAGTA